MHVFISYHHDDVSSAITVAEYLEATGLKVWVASRDIIPGQPWDAAIMSAIRDATAVVLIFSRRADQSRNIKRELMLADKGQKPLYMIRLEPMEPRELEYLLATSQWVDWTRQGDLSGLGKLATALGGSLPVQETTNALSGWPSGSHFTLTVTTKDGVTQSEIKDPPLQIALERLGELNQGQSLCLIEERFGPLERDDGLFMVQAFVYSDTYLGATRSYQLGAVLRSNSGLYKERWLKDYASLEYAADCFRGFFTQRTIPEFGELHGWRFID